MDKLKTYSQGWETENGTTKAAVCLVHGLGEHSGRYHHVAEHLTKAGFAFLGSDLHGHGKSAGRRGHVISNEEFLDEIDRLLKTASSRYPGKPLFLYGHSLGGILVLYYSLKRKPDLAGVVATGPGMRSALEKQTLKIGISKVLGTLTPEICLPTGLVVEDLSRDPDILRLYREDPLVHDQASVRMAKNLLEIIPWTFEYAHEFSWPLLLMHGTADQIVYPSGSEEFASLVECDCTVKLWEGFYHEIHNEPQKEDVMDYLVAWLDSKI
jgi:alpha-beta hydrolase superfamily lysophospholipase